MSGYYEFSKSNNAIAAENGGRYPATILAKRIGVKTAAIKAILTPCEWHHTSKHYNCTDYYDSEDALERLDELKSWKEPDKEVEVFESPAPATTPTLRRCHSAPSLSPKKENGSPSTSPIPSPSANERTPAAFTFTTTTKNL